MNVPVSCPKPNIETSLAGEKRAATKNTTVIKPRDRSNILLGRVTSPCLSRDSIQIKNATDIAIENRNPFAISKDIPKTGIKNMGKRNTTSNRIQNAIESRLKDIDFLSFIKMLN